MENSIEEDIKILEEFKTNGYSILLMKYGDRIKANFKLAKALEHILSEYKRVLKENEELHKEIDRMKSLDIYKLVEDWETGQLIPIQKIKDKIEELNQYYKKEIYPSLSQWRDISITEHYDEMIELLQEIIGDK